MKAKPLCLCCFLRSQCHEGEEHFSFPLYKRKKQKKSQSYWKGKQKEESIALSLGYKHGTTRSGKLLKVIHRKYILLYWLVTQKRSTANNLICTAMATLCSCLVSFFLKNKKAINKDWMFVLTGKVFWTFNKVTYSCSNLAKYTHWARPPKSMHGQVCDGHYSTWLMDIWKSKET